MRKSRFSEVQIVHILRQVDIGEKTVGQLCREHGISENTFYRWRRRYGGMGLPELRRQRSLEQENARLIRFPGISCALPPPERQKAKTVEPMIAQIIPGKRMKRLLAERDLEVDALRELLAKKS